MEKKGIWMQYATAANGVKAASFIGAAMSDYAAWQVLWGIWAYSGLSSLYKSWQNESVVSYAFQGISGSLCAAASVASALTGDPMNAQSLGFAASGFFSGIMSDIFRRKSEAKRSGLKYVLRSEESLEALIQKEEKKAIKSAAPKKKDSKLRRFFRKVRKVANIAVSLAGIGFVGTVSYFNAPTYVDYFSNPLSYKAEKVTEKDAIIEYVKGKNPAAKDEAGRRMEALIEADLTELMGEKAYINTYWGETKNAIVMSPKGKVDRISSVLSRGMFRNLSEYEKIGVEKLASAVGPEKVRMIDVDEPYVISFGGFIKRHFNELYRFNLDEIAAGLASENFGISEGQARENLKEYSAYVATIGGLTVASPFFQIISINESIDSLHRLAFVYGHEAGHALVIKNSSAFSAACMIAGMQSGEGLIINETGADIIGKAAAERFMQNHLDKALVGDFLKSSAEEEKGKGIYAKIVREASALADKADGSLERYISQLEAERKAKGAVHYTMNTAMISVMKTYSGKEEVKKELEFLYGKLGMKGFVTMLSRAYTFEKLDEIYKQYKEE